MPFQGLPFIVVGTYSAGTPIAPGDLFQLYTGSNLKEATVFTVKGITPSAGWSAWNVFFSPSPIAQPTNSDTATSVAAPKNLRALGAIGHVSNLTYSSTCPGGPDSMSCLLRLPPNYRTDALDPGRVVQIWRGGSCVWEGKLNEPSSATEGWTVTAHGAGTYGADFTNYYLNWSADEPVNRAIARGLRWVNPGIGAPSGIYLSQVQDSGSQSITAFLNLITGGGALLWQVTPGITSSPPAKPWILRVFPLPADSNGMPTADPTRIIVSHSPVPRTLAADITNIALRYQATADTASTATTGAVAATYATVYADNNASASRHGRMEYYLDLSSAGVITAAAARQIGQNLSLIHI